MEHGVLLLVLASIFSFFMAWGVGANDVANAMGTSVGSKALTIKRALIIAAVFEFAGAYLAGGEVTQTIRSQIINPELLVNYPNLFVYGMLASLLAAASWLAIASYFGWPVSTTHSIVGAVVGFAIATFGVHAVHWSVINEILLSWIVTPILSGIISFLIFNSLQWLIFQRSDPLKQAKRYVPLYIFFVAFILSLVTLTKGLIHLGLGFGTHQAIEISVLIGILMTLVGFVFLYSLKPKENTGSVFTSVERVFAILMVFTACSMAFAHGSNDVANAIGPLSAVVHVILSGGDIGVKSPIPHWVLFLGATGIIIGLGTYGYRVIATVGNKITELTPSRGFAAELATASTVVIASGTGLPISTTQTLVGAVLGVGFARGISALDLRVIGSIFTSWIITLPAGALLSVVFYYIIKFIFS